MKTLTRTRAIGGSLIVTIPIEIVREENIKEGELVEIEVEKIRKSGFGILKGMGRFTEKDRKEILERMYGRMEKENRVFAKQVEFKHPEIKRVLEEMIESNSTKPH